MRPTRGELLLLLVACSTATAFALFAGRDQVIRGDDLFYAQRLAEGSVGHVILHSNVYLLALPMVLYKAAFATAGMKAYWVLRAMAGLLSAACAAILYLLLRPRAGPRCALAAAVVLMLLGAGAEVILTGQRLPTLIAIGTGLGAWLALGRGTSRGDLTASALLTIAVTSHPAGLGLLAGAGVLVLLSGSGARFRRLWILLLPAAAFGAYHAFFQIGGDSRATFADLVAFEWDSWATVVAGVTGLYRVTSQPVFDTTAAQALAAVVLAGIIATVVLRRAKLSPLFWAAATTLVVLAAATRLAPYGFIRSPESERYVYPAAVVLLVVLAETASAWTEGLAGRNRQLLAGAALPLLAAALLANISGLSQAGGDLRALSNSALGQYSAYELDRARIDPDYGSSPLLPTAGNYLTAADTFGNVGLDAATLPRAPDAVRGAADRALAGGLGLQLRPATNCSRAGPAVPPGSAVPLPVGGATVDPQGEPPAVVYLLRFSDGPAVSLVWPDGSPAALLRVPAHDAPTPWRLLSGAGSPIRLCPRRVPGAS